MKKLFRDEYGVRPWVVVGGLISIFIIGIVGCTIAMNAEFGRFIRRCVTDTRTPFDCERLWSEAQADIIPIPIIIPIGR